MLVRRTLGRACAEARERADVPAAEIADRAGVSRATISRLETGQYLVERVEEIVEVYELLCGLPDGELWRRAVASA